MSAPAPSTLSETRWLSWLVCGLVLLLLIVLLVLAWQAGLIAYGQGGALSGRVLYHGTLPAPEKLIVVADVAVCSRIAHYDQRLQVNAQGGIRDAVVSLVEVQGGRTLEAMGSEFVLDQRVCAYHPHVLLAPVKAPVQVRNSDGIFHNIHTFSSRNAPVNLSQSGDKKTLELEFAIPEKVQVRCDVHGWMSAWIVAVGHPYHALSDSAGRFTLKGIPPGTYIVKCWQELLGEQQTEVIIADGEEVALDFVFAEN
jgi:hypothetical protein